MCPLIVVTPGAATLVTLLIFLEACATVVELELMELDATDSVALDVATLTTLLVMAELCTLTVATLVAVTLVTLFVLLEACDCATVVELELDVAMVTEKKNQVMLCLLTNMHT